MTITDRRSGAISESIGFKAPCRAATTANITLNGLQTIDGVAVVADDRVLVKDQTTASQNGIYIAATGNWERAPDFASNGEVFSGTMVFVGAGTVAGGNVYRVTTANPIVIDTTSMAFESADLVGATHVIKTGDTMTGTLNITPTAGTSKGYNITQTVSGSPTGVAAWNQIKITADNADASGADAVMAMGLYLEHYTGGSSTKGSRQSIFVHQVVQADAAVSASNRDYIGIGSQVDSNAVMPVTATPATLFGYAATIKADAPSTGINGLVGAEIGIAPNVAGIPYVIGWNVTYQGSQQASTRSIGYQVSATATGWQYAFALTNNHGNNALASTGTVMALLEAQTVDTLFNFSLATVTTNNFNLPNYTMSGSVVAPTSKLIGSSSANHVLRINGVDQCAFYADASQVIMGASGNVPLNLITNNTAKVTISTAGQVALVNANQVLGTSAGAGSEHTLVVRKTGIANNSATAVITVTVPNAAHNAAIFLDILGHLGTGTDASESSRCATGSIVLARTAGVDTVAVASTLEAATIATVSGGGTLTLAYAVSAISGASSATQTFNITLTLVVTGTITDHTAVVSARLLNSAATGVTMAAA